MAKKITTTKHNERQAIAAALQTIREEFAPQMHILWEVWGRGNDPKRLSDLKRLRREVVRLATAIQRTRARNIL